MSEDQKRKKKLTLQIFNKWKIDFIEFDKKREAVKDNFDSLFYQLFVAAVGFDIAYDIIDDAVAHHLPSESVAKHIWKIRRRHVKTTYGEWLGAWRDSIKKKAYQSFYEFYSVEEPAVQKITKATKEGKIGPFSPAEYARQRNYADSFETLPSVSEVN